MPQDRLIHPRCGHGDRTTKLTDFEFCVWIQYVLSADDFGVMRASAVTLQADSDRLLAKKPAIVQRALEQVISVKLITAFDHQGRRYVYQSDWQDWQGITYPRSTVNPLPPDPELEKCSPKTLRHFSLHPHKHLSKVLQKLSEDFTPSRARETATANGERLLRERGSGGKPPNGRSKRPIFTGQRVVVFDWQLEDLAGMLGPYAEQFDLHEWFFTLDRMCLERNEIPPSNDRGEWLKTVTLREAQSRGYPLKLATTPQAGKQTTRLASALANIATEGK